MASRITELAALISTHTNTVEHYLQSNGLHPPSFNVDGPVQLGIKDPKIEAARLAVIEASIELHDLLVGPVALTRPEVSAMLPTYEMKLTRYLVSSATQAVFRQSIDMRLRVRSR